LTATRTEWRGVIRPAVLLVLSLAFLSSACEREPLDLVCTEMGVGDLAISELRGNQSGTDTWGQWIELYNPSAAEVSLRGLTLTLRQLDGTGEKSIRIRDDSLVVASGGRVVLGRFSNDDLPAHVDYGYEGDFSSDLYRDGLLQVFSCDQEIDRIVYHDLPSLGTLSFDGALALTAASNDEEADWCVDDTPAEAGDGGTTMVGVPGTPREANRACP
jgi:hypothetical protein